MDDHEEFLKKFDDDVQFMAQIVAPDDVYQFAEQLHLAGMHFLRVLNDNGLLKMVYESCKESRVWANNLVSYQMCKQNREIVQLDLGFRREISD